jgi:hypothetical protein
MSAKGGSHGRCPYNVSQPGRIIATDARIAEAPPQTSSAWRLNDFRPHVAEQHSRVRTVDVVSKVKNAKIIVEQHYGRPFQNSRLFGAFGVLVTTKFGIGEVKTEVSGK